MDKIVITTSSFGKYDKKPFELLEKRSMDVVLNPYGRKLSKEETLNICRDAIGVIAGTEAWNMDVIKKMKNIRVISRCGAGMDNVDLVAAKKYGIKVFNVSDGPTMAVAELTIAMMLNLLRKVDIMDVALKNGKWEKLMGNLINTKKIGIIGFGRIGSKVAELLKVFGCKIKYSDPFLEDDAKGFEHLSLKELLLWSDIVSIHVSTNKEIIGPKEINLMRKGTWLLNLSRGNIVDERALYNALKSGHLSSAALDVFKEEPYNGPLKELDNIILTPHIGSYAIESRSDMELESVKNLLKGLKY